MTPKAAQTALTEMVRAILASSDSDEKVMTLIEANDDAPAPLWLPEDACWRVEALGALQDNQQRADRALALIDVLAPALGTSVEEVFAPLRGLAARG